MEIHLNPELEHRIALKLESGRYRSAAEVIEQGLNLLEARDSAEPGTTGRSERPVWEVMAEIGRSVPEEAWSSIPTDLSKNVDRFLYGAPKEAE